MKSQLLLSILMIIAITGVYGQKPTITLIFTADENGQHLPLNSILIENLTREIDTTLYAPDTVLVIDYLVRVNENLNIGGDGFYLSQNYPNPFGGETTVDLFLPETENLQIIVSDMLGRELVIRNFRLERGNHSFTFYPGTESLYFLTARSDRYSQTIKMINTPAQSLSLKNCALKYNGAKSGFEQYKSENEETSFVYYLGDLLKFTAFANIGERVISSSPTGDRTYHFNFTGTSCPGIPTVTDIDGNVYNTVMIGDQCWMKENLKTTTYRNGTPIPNVTNNDEWGNLITGAYSWYGNLIQWKESYGALYNWHATVDPNDLCPEGWHVPSWDSWTQLINFAVSQGYPNQHNDPNGAGNALKSCRQLDSPLSGGCNTTEHPRWSAHGTHHGFDAFGFSALPGGYRVANGFFAYLWGYGGWWSSTETIPISAWNHHMYHYEASVIMYSYFKEYGFSVRCLRDEIPPTTYQLTLEAEPSDAGTVSGDGQYQAGEDVNISVTANPGWEFVNWTDDDGIVSTNPNFIYTMPAQDITLTANFIEGQSVFNCGEILIDPRDGQSYATVQIGYQCWLAENLNIGTEINGNQEMTNNGIYEKYCFNNDEANCDIFGGLYQWNEMMQYSTTPGVNGICPEGWHLPTVAEWTALITYVSSQPAYLCNSNTTYIAKSLAATTNWAMHTGTCTVGNNLTLNNATGFTALPGGYCHSDGSFGYLNSYGMWWSSSQYDDAKAWYQIMYFSGAHVHGDNYYKSTAYSVRCLRDDSPPPITYILNLEADPLNVGTVSGAGQYQADEDVNISATANPGWEFVNWTDDDGIVSTTPNFIYTMPAQDITLTANFIEDQGGFNCGDTLVDSRNGQSYATVQIGNQCWMAENLNIGTMIIGTQEMTDNGIIEKYCYDNEEANCDIYGGLYQWDEIMSYSNSPGAQGICLDGWHIPTDDEWTILTGFVSKQPEYLCNNDSINIAKALAANTNWIYYSDTCSVGFNLAGNNATGFSCLPGSLRLANGNFGYSLDGDGYWWSSTRYSNSYPWSHWTVYFEKSIIRSTFIKFNGASVRCIMDSIPSGNYILNLEADPANAGILDGAGKYQAGEDVNISATANPGWEFVNWTDDDGIVSTTPNFIYTMPAQDIALTAHFIIATYQLTLQAAPLNAGTVSGDGQYQAGEDVNISATANPGWEFVNWTDDYGVVSELASFTYTMPAQDITLTAHFIVKTPNWQPCPDTPTVTDFDGNVYNTVQIGDQCWMNENLKTTHYLDGTPIEYPGDSARAWQYNANGAYAWYNNDISWKDSYGALYNWHAVGNQNGLCPPGWYVPSNDDWTQLVDYVVDQGFPNVHPDPNGTGYALRSCRQLNSPLGEDCNTSEHPRWHSYNLEYGFDEFLFSALPGGRRITDGTFHGIGIGGYWWSSTESNMGKAFLRRIFYSTSLIYTDNMYKSFGHSVRCLRDEGLQSTFNLNLELNPLGVGTISGNGEYEAGEDINISATPNDGWEFVNWTDEDDQVISINMSFVFTMPPVDVTLTANFIDNTGYECGISEITDFDGNVYNTVLVGGRCWMKENLKTTTYNNGIPIPHVTDANEWISLESGAFTWYNNSSSWKDAYGALYNWYAAVDTNSLCPNGWHVPTLDEWVQMHVFLVDQGYLNQDEYFGASNALKSCRQINSPLGGDCNTNEHPRWEADNTHIGFDAFDFSALPGGMRSPTGVFGLLGYQSQWWNATEIDIEESWSQSMFYASGTIISFNSKKITGLSVRCIKDIIPNIYGLNLEAEPSNSGTISGAGQYEPDELINISANANPGWQFVNWTDDDGIVSTTPNFIYTMPAQDVILTANFIEDQGGFNCGDTLVDSRDGQSYATVQIGDQCWMAENLNIGTMIIGTQEMTDNGIIEKYCYDNEEANCDIYVGLYQWDEIMSYSNSPGAQGICLDGWHMPTDAEWMQLVDYVVAQGYPNQMGNPTGAGNALKSCRQVNSPMDGDCNTTTHPRWNQNITHSGFDEFGFSALPGGYRFIDGAFYGIGDLGFWWSSTLGPPILTWIRYMVYDTAVVYRQEGYKTSGFSVRCLKDE